MRTLLKMFFLLLIACSVKAQTPPAPAGFPTLNSNGYYKIGWIQADSGNIPAYRDTNWIPKYQGTFILYQHAGVDTALWYRLGNKWVKILKQGDVPNLTATSPIVYLNGNISCPTCGTGGGGITSLNGLTATTQTFASGSTGTDFNIVSSGSVHTFNFPTGSSSNRGFISTADWSNFNSKQPQINGTGFVVATGTSISFDNTVYYPNSNPSSFISRTGISALAPILYNSSTGVISGDTSSGITHLATQAYVLNHQTSGTITGSGNLAPLFTTSIVSNTIVFSLSNVAANSILGNNTGSTGPSSYFVPNLTTISGWLGFVPISLTSISASSPLIYNNGTGVFSIQVANTSQNGYLSSTDWNTFNNKGTGSVTSIAVTVPSSLLTITGSPITTNGTFAFALTTQTAYTSFGNWTASTATPTFGKIPYQAFASGTPNYLFGLDGSGNPTLLKPDTLFYRELGISGDSVGWISSTGIVNFRLIRDSLGFHHVTNSDNSWTFYATGGFTDPLTTNGDIIARISGSTTRLAQGGNNTFLGVQSGTLGYFAPFSLTTTGTSGVATFSAGVLNIPQYSGGGSQTFPQVLATGRTFASDDSVLLSGGRLYFKGNEIKSDSMRVRSQFINGDSLWTFSRLFQVWGYSIDIGNAVTTPLPYPYATYVGQALGFTINNRAIGGTTLVQLTSADSSMEQRMNQIATYDPNNPGILLFGGYSLNDPLNGVDSNRFKIVWDSVLVTIAHTAKGWPYSRMFMVGGTYYDTTAAGYTAHGLGYAFGQISYRKALQYGIPTIDGFAYLKAHGGATNLWTDLWHLNELGQTRIAIGILNAMTGDSINYSRMNNLIVMNAGSFNGFLNVAGNSRMSSNLTVVGNDSIGGTLGVDTLTSSMTAMWDLRIKGGQKFDSSWFNLYNSQDGNNKQFGMGMKNFGGFFNILNYVPDVGATGWMWGIRSTTTSAFTPHTTLSSTGNLALDGTLGVTGKSTLNGIKVYGSSTIDSTIFNVYNSCNCTSGSSNLWGYGLRPHSGLYSIDFYAAATGGGGFGFGSMASDGVTYTRNAYISQLGNMFLNDSFGVRGLSRLAAAIITGNLLISNPGGVFQDKQWGLYDVGVNHFGMGMGLVDATNYMTKVYGQSAGNSGVALGIIKSDGVTFQPFLMVGATFRVPSAQLPTGLNTDSIMVVRSGGPSAIDTLMKISASSLTAGVTTVGTFSGSSIANGASISTNTITFGPADATNPGMVTTGIQSFGGSKSFGSTRFNVTSDTTNLSGGIYFNQIFPSTGSNFVMSTTGYFFNLLTIGADRTFTFPTLSTLGGRTFEIVNSNGGAFKWSLTNSVVDAAGNSISTMPLVNGWTYKFTSDGAGQWYLISSTGPNGIFESSSTSINIIGNSDYIFTGGSLATWTLPTLSGHTKARYYVKNAGSVTLTIAASGSDNLYDASSVASITLAPGSSKIIIGGTSFWYVE